MKLVILNGPMRGREFALGQSPGVIGRDPGADVSLGQDPRISPFHCQIHQEPGQCWLEDLGGSMGTRVFGKAYDRRMPLFPGDVFRIGNTRITLAEDAIDAQRILGTLARHDSPPVRPPASPPALADVAPAYPGFSTIDPASLLAHVHEGDSPEVQRVVTRLRVLQDITAELAGNVHTASILAAVVDRVMRIVRAERALALVVPAGASPEAAVPVVVRRRDGAEDAAPMAPSRTVVARALKDGIAVLVDDTLADRGLDPSQSLVAAGHRSVLCVPLAPKGEVTALLYLDSTEPHAFSREEHELAMVIANQAAAALANAELYERLQTAYGDLETAHDQLVQTEKLATIGGLAASISHDIGNVITPITGVATVVLASDSVDPVLKEAFSRQMQRLKALASQLLSFSSPRPPDLVAVDLNQVVKESILLVQTEARHHRVEIRTELHEPLPPVSADPHRLDQASVNLMLNAVQAMHATGGSLTIRSGVEDGHVFLSFRDTGPGIAPAHLALLGKPFFTTKGKSGNGLGVYGCRRIVEEEHGGKLEIRSTLGEGATFIVRIPLRAAGTSDPSLSTLETRPSATA